MVLQREAGRVVWPAPVEAEGEGQMAASAGRNSCYKGCWACRQKSLLVIWRNKEGTQFNDKNPSLCILSEVKDSLFFLSVFLHLS